MSYQALQIVEANTRGRDFVVGDVHGNRERLEAYLATVKFDRQRDRLFCTGDLIDRGPLSFETLKLIEEPWFFCALGNHEAMMLTFFGERYSDYHSGSDFLRNGGHWLEELTAEEASYLETVLVPKANALPLVIKVKHPAREFYVLHAERDVYGHIATDAQITEAWAQQNETRLTWGRSLYRKMPAELAKEVVAHASGLPEGLLTEEHIALPSAERFEVDTSLTYVGHTILKTPMLFRSHAYLDVGLYHSGRCVLVDHGRFCERLANA